MKTRSRKYEKVVPCDNIDAAIEEYRSLGYRLDMISTADEPREALVSKDGETLRLTKQLTRKQGIESEVEYQALAYARASASETRPSTDEGWITGRAGMEYRDLIPGRMDGKVIASHIRLKEGGEVADYVHYHKIEFQMIYCKRGRIKVVYENQGEPFWLETGDCVLQPPEIRHRVLECTAGAEVIEVSMPAEHQTWVEYDIKLPTDEVKPDRDFGGQRFVRHVAADAEWDRFAGEEIEIRETGILAASSSVADVRVFRRKNQTNTTGRVSFSPRRFKFELGGNETLMVDFSLVG